MTSKCSAILVKSFCNVQFRLNMRLDFQKDSKNRLVLNSLNINALIGNEGAGIVLCEGNIEMSHVEGLGVVASEGNWVFVDHIRKNFSPA